MIYWPIQFTVCLVTDRHYACYRFIVEDPEKVLHSDQTGCAIDLRLPDHKSPWLLACVLSISPRRVTTLSMCGRLNTPHHEIHLCTITVGK